MNISFTKTELQVLFDEIGMIVESCDLCAEEGRPRPDDAQIRSIYRKLRQATQPPTVSDLQRQLATIQKVNAALWSAAGVGPQERHSKWDRFREAAT